jgi:hypothetical protein
MAMLVWPTVRRRGRNSASAGGSVVPVGRRRDRVVGGRDRRGWTCCQIEKRPAWPSGWRSDPASRSSAGIELRSSQKAPRTGRPKQNTEGSLVMSVTRNVFVAALGDGWQVLDTNVPPKPDGRLHSGGPVQERLTTSAYSTPSSPIARSDPARWRVETRVVLVNPHSSRATTRRGEVDWWRPTIVTGT